MTFFSGTDLSTLREEGADANHFVSLIVNNAGVYAAAITRKVTSTSKGIRNLKYNTFDDVPINDEREEFEYEDTCIEYYTLEVHKEAVPEIPKSELELRLIKLKDSKNSYINRSTLNNDWSSYKSFLPSSTPSYNESRVTQPTLFTEEEMGNIKKPTEKKSTPYYMDETEIAYGKDLMPKNIVDDTILQIVTGDIFAPYKNLDLDKWVKNMDSVYTKRFGPNPKGNTENHFEYWADSFVDFLEEDLPETALDKKGFDYRDAIWAFDVLERLDKYFEKYPKNQYLEIFIKTLEKWLI